jgi:hypothetical protein
MKNMLELTPMEHDIKPKKHNALTKWEMTISTFA